MHHAGMQQYGPGAMPSTQQYPTQQDNVPPGAPTTTTSLRQWRKKQNTPEPPMPIQENQGPIARIAPHAHYPRPAENYRFPQQYPQEFGLPYKELSPAPVKYSEIVEPATASHLTPVIQRPKEKEYLELCNVQQNQHLKPYQDAMKPTYANVVQQQQQYGNKESQQLPQHSYVSKEGTQFAPAYLQNYKMTNQYQQPTRQFQSPNETNNFNLEMYNAQRHLNAEHHLSMYHLEQRQYANQRIYRPNSAVHTNLQYRNTPQQFPVQNYPNFKQPVQNNDLYNRLHTYQPQVPKYHTQEYKIPHHVDTIRNISPRRLYPDNNPYGNKFNQNTFNPCAQLEYAQHYQNRRPEMQQQNENKLNHLLQNRTMPDLITENTPKSSLKSFIETWNDDVSEIQEQSNDINKTRLAKDPNNEKLYIYDSTEIASDNIHQFLHLQVEKLPDNITGFYKNTVIRGSQESVVNLAQESVIKSSLPVTEINPLIENPSKELITISGELPSLDDTKNCKLLVPNQNTLADYDGPIKLDEILSDAKEIIPIVSSLAVSKDVPVDRIVCPTVSCIKSEASPKTVEVAEDQLSPQISVISETKRFLDNEKQKVDRNSSTPNTVIVYNDTSDQNKPEVLDKSKDENGGSNDDASEIIEDNEGQSNVSSPDLLSNDSNKECDDSPQIDASKLMEERCPNTRNIVNEEAPTLFEKMNSVIKDGHDFEQKLVPNKIGEDISLVNSDFKKEECQNMKFNEEITVHKDCLSFEDESAIVGFNSKVTKCDENMGINQNQTNDCLLNGSSHITKDVASNIIINSKFNVQLANSETAQQRHVGVLAKTGSENIISKQIDDNTLSLGDLQKNAVAKEDLMYIQTSFANKETISNENQPSSPVMVSSSGTGILSTSQHGEAENSQTKSSFPNVAKDIAKKSGDARELEASTRLLPSNQTKIPVIVKEKSMVLHIGGEIIEIKVIRNANKNIISVVPCSDCTVITENLAEAVDENMNDVLEHARLHLVDESIADSDRKSKVLGRDDTILDKKGDMISEDIGQIKDNIEDENIISQNDDVNQNLLPRSIDDDLKIEECSNAKDVYKRICQNETSNVDAAEDIVPNTNVVEKVFLNEAERIFDCDPDIADDASIRKQTVASNTGNEEEKDSTISHETVLEVGCRKTKDFNPVHKEEVALDLQPVKAKSNCINDNNIVYQNNNDVQQIYGPRNKQVIKILDMFTIKPKKALVASLIIPTPEVLSYGPKNVEVDFKATAEDFGIKTIIKSPEEINEKPLLKNIEVSLMPMKLRKKVRFYTGNLKKERRKTISECISTRKSPRNLYQNLDESDLDEIQDNTKNLEVKNLRLNRRKSFDDKYPTLEQQQIGKRLEVDNSPNLEQLQRLSDNIKDSVVENRDADVIGTLEDKLNKSTEDNEVVKSIVTRKAPRRFSTNFDADKLKFHESTENEMDKNFRKLRVHTIKSIEDDNAPNLEPQQKLFGNVKYSHLENNNLGQSDVHETKYSKSTKDIEHMTRNNARRLSLNLDKDHLEKLQYQETTKKLQDNFVVKNLRRPRLNTWKSLEDDAYPNLDQQFENTKDESLENGNLINSAEETYKKSTDVEVVKSNVACMTLRTKSRRSLEDDNFPNIKDVEAEYRKSDLVDTPEAKFSKSTKDLKSNVEKKNIRKLSINLGEDHLNDLQIEEDTKKVQDNFVVKTPKKRVHTKQSSEDYALETHQILFDHVEDVDTENKNADLPKEKFSKSPKDIELVNSIVAKNNVSKLSVNLDEDNLNEKEFQESTNKLEQNIVVKNLRKLRARTKTSSEDDNCPNLEPEQVLLDNIKDLDAENSKAEKGIDSFEAKINKSAKEINLVSKAAKTNDRRLSTNLVEDHLKELQFKESTKLQQNVVVNNLRKPCILNLTEFIEDEICPNLEPQQILFDNIEDVDLANKNSELIDASEATFSKSTTEIELRKPKLAKNNVRKISTNLGEDDLNKQDFKVTTKKLQENVVVKNVRKLHLNPSKSIEDDTCPNLECEQIFLGNNKDVDAANRNSEVINSPEAKNCKSIKEIELVKPKVAKNNARNLSTNLGEDHLTEVQVKETTKNVVVKNLRKGRDNNKISSEDVNSSSLEPSNDKIEHVDPAKTNSELIDNSDTKISKSTNEIELVKPKLAKNNVRKLSTDSDKDDLSKEFTNKLQENAVVKNLRRVRGNTSKFSEDDICRNLEAQQILLDRIEGVEAENSNEDLIDAFKAISSKSNKDIDLVKSKQTKKNTRKLCANLGEDNVNEIQSKETTKKLQDNVVVKKLRKLRVNTSKSVKDDTCPNLEAEKVLLDNIKSVDAENKNVDLVDAPQAKCNKSTKDLVKSKLRKNNAQKLFTNLDENQSNDLQLKQTTKKLQQSVVVKNLRKINTRKSSEVDNCPILEPHPKLCDNVEDSHKENSKSDLIGASEASSKSTEDIGHVKSNVTKKNARKLTNSIEDHLNDLQVPKSTKNTLVKKPIKPLANTNKSSEVDDDCPTLEPQLKCYNIKDSDPVDLIEEQCINDTQNIEEVLDKTVFEMPVLECERFDILDKNKCHENDVYDIAENEVSVNANIEENFKYIHEDNVQVESIDVINDSCVYEEENAIISNCGEDLISEIICASNSLLEKQIIVDEDFNERNVSIKEDTEELVDVNNTVDYLQNDNVEDISSPYSPTTSMSEMCTSICEIPSDIDVKEFREVKPFRTHHEITCVTNKQTTSELASILEDDTDAKISDNEIFNDRLSDDYYLQYDANDIVIDNLEHAIVNEIEIDSSISELDAITNSILKPFIKNEESQQDVVKNTKKLVVKLKLEDSLIVDKHINKCKDINEKRKDLKTKEETTVIRRKSKKVKKSKSKVEKDDAKTVDIKKSAEELKIVEKCKEVDRLSPDVKKINKKTNMETIKPLEPLTQSPDSGKRRTSSDNTLNETVLASKHNFSILSKEKKKKIQVKRPLINTKKLELFVEPILSPKLTEDKPFKSELKVKTKAELKENSTIYEKLTQVEHLIDEKIQIEIKEPIQKPIVVSVESKKRLSFEEYKRKHMKDPSKLKEDVNNKITLEDYKRKRNTTHVSKEEPKKRRVSQDAETKAKTKTELYKANLEAQNTKIINDLYYNKYGGRKSLGYKRICQTKSELYAQNSKRIEYKQNLIKASSTLKDPRLERRNYLSKQNNPEAKSTTPTVISNVEMIASKIVNLIDNKDLGRADLKMVKEICTKISSAAQIVDINKIEENDKKILNRASKTLLETVLINVSRESENTEGALDHSLINLDVKSVEESQTKVLKHSVGVDNVRMTHPDLRNDANDVILLQDKIDETIKEIDILHTKLSEGLNTNGIMQENIIPLRDINKTEISMSLQSNIKPDTQSKTNYVCTNEILIDENISGSDDLRYKQKSSSNLKIITPTDNKINQTEKKTLKMKSQHSQQRTTEAVTPKQTPTGCEIVERSSKKQLEGLESKETLEGCAKAKKICKEITLKGLGSNDTKQSKNEKLNSEKPERLQEALNKKIDDLFSLNPKRGEEELLQKYRNGDKLRHDELNKVKAVLERKKFEQRNLEHRRFKLSFDLDNLNPLSDVTKPNHLNYLDRTNKLDGSRSFTKKPIIDLREIEKPIADATWSLGCKRKLDNKSVTRSIIDLDDFKVLEQPKKRFIVDLDELVLPKVSENDENNCKRKDFSNSWEEDDEPFPNLCESKSNNKVPKVDTVDTHTNLKNDVSEQIVENTIAKSDNLLIDQHIADDKQKPIDGDFNVNFNTKLLNIGDNSTNNCSSGEPNDLNRSPSNGDLVDVLKIESSPILAANIDECVKNDYKIIKNVEKTNFNKELIVPNTEISNPDVSNLEKIKKKYSTNLDVRNRSRNCKTNKHSEDNAKINSKEDQGTSISNVIMINEDALKNLSSNEDNASSSNASNSQRHADEKMRCKMESVNVINTKGLDEVQLVEDDGLKNVVNDDRISASNEMESMVDLNKNEAVLFPDNVLSETPKEVDALVGSQGTQTDDSFMQGINTKEDIPNSNTLHMIVQTNSQNNNNIGDVFETKLVPNKSKKDEIKQSIVTVDDDSIKLVSMVNNGNTNLAKESIIKEVDLNQTQSDETDENLQSDRDITTGVIGSSIIESDRDNLIQSSTDDDSGAVVNKINDVMTKFRQRHMSVITSDRNGFANSRRRDEADAMEETACLNDKLDDVRAICRESKTGIGKTITKPILKHSVDGILGNTNNFHSSVGRVAVKQGLESAGVAPENVFMIKQVEQYFGPENFQYFNQTDPLSGEIKTTKHKHKTKAVANPKLIVDGPIIDAAEDETSNKKNHWTHKKLIIEAETKLKNSKVEHNKPKNIHYDKSKCKTDEKLYKIEAKQTTCARRNSEDLKLRLKKVDPTPVEELHHYPVSTAPKSDSDPLKILLKRVVSTTSSAHPDDDDDNADEKQVKVKRQRKRKRFRNLYAADSDDNNESVKDYSVFESKNQTGLPKLIIKRKVDLREHMQPVVQIVRDPHLDNLAKKKRKI